MLWNVVMLCILSHQMLYKIYLTINRHEKQWGDLAFCLAQLPYSERCLHKLQENLNCYQDKLYNDEVYQNLTAISTRTKKFAKPEVKVSIM